MTRDWRQWRFSVPGEPLPWMRSGQNGRRHYQPPEQLAYQLRIARAALDAGVVPLAGPVELCVAAFLSRRSEPHLTGSGDGDNYFKQVCDALQGRRARPPIAFRDDAQVVVGRFEKSVDAQLPRLEVFLAGEPAALSAPRLRPPRRRSCALPRRPVPALYR